MLIAIWMLLTKIALPGIGTILSVLINATMPIIIMCVGITILLSAVGIRTHFSLFGTICSSVIGAIGYLGRTLITAIGWCLRHILLFIPAFFSGTRNSFTKGGMSVMAANVISVIATIVLIAIII